MCKNTIEDEGRIALLEKLAACIADTTDDEVAAIMLFMKSLHDNSYSGGEADDHL